MLLLLKRNIIDLQIHGTAIGTYMTQLTQLYTNLFLGKLEQEFLRIHNTIPQVWWRYTDDVFTIWDHDEPSLRIFWQNFDCHHSSVKFTATWSAEQVVFLDARDYLKNSRIENDLHVKPTGKHWHLHTDRCDDLKHCKTAFLYRHALHS